MKPLLCLLLILASAGTLQCSKAATKCAETPPTAATASADLSQLDAGFQAGVAIADITPPLHLSLFGHGPEGRIAAGVRLRLRCQAFLIASGPEMVALVPCDLQSPSMALHREVAKHLKAAKVPISADRLFLMATHTHGAPGHYFDAERYSGPFSSLNPGFAQDVLDFLSVRIADAIKQAFDAIGPACVGWGQTDFVGGSFNRSLIPFLANRGGGAEEMLRREVQANAESVTGAEKAVDPRLFLLRVDRREKGIFECPGNKPPLGVLSVFGVHPTGIPNTNDLYHGDIFGFATRTAAACLSGATSGTKPDSAKLQLPDCPVTNGVENTEAVVVGLANGVEGDVSPKVTVQSVASARRLGRRLGQTIAQKVIGLPLQAKGVVQRAYWELDFPSGQYDDNEKHRLCAEGELGSPTAGGAPDGPTRLRAVPAANPGFRLNKPNKCHGYKLPVHSGFGPGSEGYPSLGAIGLIQIGSARFATLPAEITTTVAMRLRQALSTWLPPQADPKSDLAIVGLTNQYFQYVATPEEYDFQYYEGASTLYGPHTSKFLLRHFQCLAAGFGTNRTPGCVGRPVNEPADIKWAEPTVSRMPPKETCESLMLESPKVYVSSRDGDPGWEMTFDELPPTFTGDRSTFHVDVLAGASTPQGEHDTVVDDDRGSAIEVRELDGGQWRVRWTPLLAPTCDPRCGKTYRLAVRGHYSFESKPFKVDACSCPTQPKEPAQ